MALWILFCIIHTIQSKAEMFVLRNNEVSKKLKKQNNKNSLPLKLKRVDNNVTLMVNANFDGPNIRYNHFYINQTGYFLSRNQTQEGFKSGLEHIGITFVDITINSNRSYKISHIELI